jgi:hypothetical protein
LAPVDDKPGNGWRGGAGDRANHLLARGLELYTAGDLLGALAEWEAALALDPTLMQAQEYIDYVRENYEALDAQFRAAREAERAAAQLGVPMPSDDRPYDDPDAYDSLDVEMGPFSGEQEPIEMADGLAAVDAGLDQVLDAPTHPPPRAVITRPRVVGDHDDEEQTEPPALEMEAMAPDEDLPGMAPELEEPDEPDEPDEEDATIDARSPMLARNLAEDAFDDLPPQGSRPGILTIQPRLPGQAPGHDSPLDLDLGPPTLELGAQPIALDDGPAGSTMRHEPPRIRPAATTGELGAVGDDEATRAFERRGPPQPSTRSTFSTYDPEDLPTRRRQPLPRDDYAESELTSDYSRTRQAGPNPSSVIIDERLLRGAGVAQTAVRPGTDPERTNDFRPRPGARETGRDAREERVHKRVAELLRQAEEWAGKGDYLKAVLAVEAASKDDEDGTVAPALLHRHRELLYRIYEGHIGDLTAVPLVAVPLHEIAGESLDHRTGFLLSRIDGMLTFEDILDIAGMPRMEAYQILSSLLRKGVIEVR